MDTCFCLDIKKLHTFLVSVWNFQLSIRILFLRFYTMTAKGFFHVFKSHLHRCFSSGSKLIFLTVHSNICLFIQVIFPDCLKHLLSNQYHQILFIH